LLDGALSGGRFDELVTLSTEARVQVIAHLVRQHHAGAYRGTAAHAAQHAWEALLASLDEVEGKDLSALIHAVAATGPCVCMYPWRECWELAERVIAREGIGPELHDALRSMQAVMNVHRSDKNAAIAIDQTLFFEHFSELDTSRCAADRVRRDLRAMPFEQARAWEKLLLHGMAASQAEPKPSWSARADALARRIDDVNVRAREWLAEIAAVEPLTLRAAGADALRALLWVATPRDDPPTEPIVALATKPYRRGRTWTPRHDRYVGALAWALGVTRPAGAVAMLSDLHARFGRTTAKYAITGALAKIERG
jgi:hypothetical protein